MTQDNKILIGRIIDQILTTAVVNIVDKLRYARNKCYVLLYIGLLLAFAGCNAKGSSYSNEYQHDEEYNTTEDLDTDVVKQDNPVTDEETVRPDPISKYYHEGYDAGYEAGRDDAVRGWELKQQFQFDSSCDYSGKKKEKYIQGYEDGYLYGYNENKKR